MTSLAPYPSNLKKTLDSIYSCLQQIVRLRSQDSQAFNNLSSTFIMGRKVAKVPANSTDVAGNVPGDFAVTASFVYFCIDTGGTAEWVRAPVAVF